ACKKLLRQGGDNLPLLRARILRLIDKDMLDAAIKLEHDPGRYAITDKQIAGFQDQIVIIKPSATGLFRLVALDQRKAEPQQRRGGGEHPHLVYLFFKRDNPLALFLEDVEN